MGRFLPSARAAPACEVSAETTGAAALRLRGEGGERVLALNFASAKNAGGGFINGAKAQEEDLARASALYPCLIGQRGYYEANRRCGSMIYTDHLIYSPDVPFFRDDGWALLERAAPPLRADPDHHAFLAALYQREGKHDQAARLYREVLRLDWRRAAWWMGLGISLEAEGRPDGALAAYRGTERVGGLDPASQRFVEARIEELAGLSPSPPTRRQR